MSGNFVRPYQLDLFIPQSDWAANVRLQVSGLIAERARHHAEYWVHVDRAIECSDEIDRVGSLLLDEEV